MVLVFRIFLKEFFILKGCYWINEFNRVIEFKFKVKFNCYLIGYLLDNIWNELKLYVI